MLQQKARKIYGKITAAFLSVMFAVSAFPTPTSAVTIAEDAPLSGEYSSFGDNIHYWEFDDGTLTISGNGTVYYCEPCPWEHLKQEIHTVIVEGNVRTVISDAFKDCKQLTKVQIGESVESIGDSAFQGCEKLETVIFPNKTDVTFGYSLQLDSYAFSNCTSLREITIPTRGYIGNWAFENCSSLETVHFVGDSHDIQYESFINCTALKNIQIPENSKIGLHAFSGCTALESVLIGEGCKTISAQAFFGCTALETVQVGEGITKLTSRCFEGCTALRSVTLPASVQSIGEECFKDCESLTELILPNGAVEIDDTAFKGAEQIFKQKGDFRILADKYLYEFTGGSVAEIPEGVTLMLRQAFQGHSGLTSVTIPESLTQLNDEMFKGCTGLQQVSLPSTLTYLPTSMFEDCTSLTQIEIPEGVTEIGENCFAGCTSLTDVRMPDDIQITAFPAYLFQNCESLAHVDFPEQLQTVGYQCFDGCTSFEAANTVDGLFCADGRYLITYTGSEADFVVPDGIIYIAESAFQGNADVQSVTCSKSVKRIGANAFSGCSSLKKLSILPSVIAIGKQANFTRPHIWCQPDSAAYDFALRYGCEYSFLPYEVPLSGRDMTIDYATDVWYFGNSNQVFKDGYYMSETAYEAAKDYLLGSESLMDKGWAGSCFGLAATVILAKNGLFTPDQLQSGAKHLSEVEPTDEVISLINYYHFVQHSKAYTVKAVSEESMLHKAYCMQQIAMAVPDGASPMLIEFVTGGGGGHAIVGYGIEDGEWEWNGKVYDQRILVWDSNSPGVQTDETQVYLDSQTYDYCIPAYNVYYEINGSSNSGRINMVVNDLDLLNAYPYPSEDTAITGDLTGDGIADVRDAVALARLVAEDETLSDTINITAQTWRNADIDGDGMITLVDCTALLALLANPV